MREEQSRQKVESRKRLRRTRQEQGDMQGPQLTFCLETKSGANRFLCDKPETGHVLNLKGPFTTRHISCLSKTEMA